MLKNQISYAFKDPVSGGFSASRISSIWFSFWDIVWLITCIIGLPPKETYVPVSVFMSTCTTVAFAAYGLNSFAGGWKHNIADIASSVFSKTTTTSQVDTGPPTKTKVKEGE